MKPHYFFAAVLPDHVKEAIWEEMNRRSFPFKRMVHPEDYHITLSFIGAAENRFLQKACEQIKEALKDQTPIAMELGSFHTFGSSASPRIFWIGTNEPEPLFHVQSSVEAACKAAGFKVDDRPYRPHVTTARKWEADYPYKESRPPEWPSFKINEVALYESNQTKNPKYEKKWICLLNE